ncbi:MAG: TetR family transcriptional regulator [Alphaproteobacteria bacterium]|nr:TetR family transcriptional regulator [Alphaproteobacteria bacterium]
MRKTVPAQTKRRRSHAESRHASMTLILDCAEAEFAEKGYNGATLTSVAELAGVDTSLMRYYFGDKERLFEAVFMRRAPASNELRRQAMAHYRETAGANMTLEGIVDAFTRPVFELGAKDPGWRNYLAIVAYVSTSSGPMRTLMTQAFDYVSYEMIADMKRVIPNVPEEDIYWAYYFMSGSYTFSLGQTERIGVLSNGKISALDFAEIARRLPIFVGAGLRAMFAAGPAIKKRPFRAMPKDALRDELEDWQRHYSRTTSMAAPKQGKRR